MTETTAGRGIGAQLPPQIRRNLIQVDHDDRQAKRDEDTELAQRCEEAANRGLALGIAAAEARGEYPGPVELSQMRLPADDEERDARTQSAIKFVLDTQRAQYQRELAWEKDHPRTPAGPPEKLHIEFIDDPNIIAPAARSEIGWRIFHRSRRWQEWLERKTAAENARRATLADRDLGLINVQPGRSGGRDYPGPGFQ